MLSALQQLTAWAVSTLPAYPSPRTKPVFLPGPRVTNRASISLLFYLSIKSFVHVGSGAPPGQLPEHFTKQSHPDMSSRP